VYQTHELGEKIAASFLYQVHLYHWLRTATEDSSPTMIWDRGPFLIRMPISCGVYL